MFKFLIGFFVGLFAGFLLGHLLPMQVLLFAGMGLVVLAMSLLILFHLGLQDFQEY
ncbi:MAG: hypothetical protein HY869_06265 [Chloroflexi bacterium]|nr:hypothetical protein [Chloroflexota bacterium]